MITQKINLMLLAVCTTITLSAQKEWTFNWHFGEKVSLGFSSGAPMLGVGSEMQTAEGCASISDEAGNLLFYTNGGGRDPIQSGGQPSGKIWNRLNEVMYDMSFTEGGGWSAAQSSIIFPKPEDAGKYYLFTMEEAEFDIGGTVPGQPLGRGLSYFVVDMALNGGLGGVEAYAEGIYLPTYEGLCAVGHPNGIDYWVVVHQNDQSGFAVLPVTANGVGNPILYDFNRPNSGLIKASPDGQWLSASSGDSLALYRFDWITGELSSPLLLPGVSQAEFSANSRYLYGTASANSRTILRFDLEAPDVPASQALLAILPETIGSAFALLTGYFQLGPDRNIYFFAPYADAAGWRYYLSAITCANTGGILDANFLLLKETDGTGLPFFGLPNFPAQWLADESADILSVDLGEDELLCPGEAIVLDAGIPDGRYLWSTGDTTRQIEASTTGLYSVTVTAGCGLGTDAISISLVEVEANAGPDVEVCAGSAVLLQASARGNFSWQPAEGLSNPNDITPLASPAQDVVYVLTAEAEGCIAEDTVSVRVLPIPVAAVEPADTTIAPGEAVAFLASAGFSYSWSPAAGLSCSDCPNPLTMPEATTAYILTVLNAEGCAASDTVWVNVNELACLLAAPNAFTPNGDGINDFFKPLSLRENELRFSIYNRWGQRVYEHSPGTAGWDGNFQGQPAPSDVYFFVAAAQLCGQEQVLRGDVSLLR
jgi:gliding motility-associated-like protein